MLLVAFAAGGTIVGFLAGALAPARNTLIDLQTAILAPAGACVGCLLGIAIGMGVT